MPSNSMFNYVVPEILKIANEMVENMDFVTADAVYQTLRYQKPDALAYIGGKATGQRIAIGRLLGQNFAKCKRVYQGQQQTIYYRDEDAMLIGLAVSEAPPKNFTGLDEVLAEMKQPMPLWAILEKLEVPDTHSNRLQLAQDLKERGWSKRVRTYKGQRGTCWLSPAMAEAPPPRGRPRKKRWCVELNGHRYTGTDWNGKETLLRMGGKEVGDVGDTGGAE